MFVTLAWEISLDQIVDLLEIVFDRGRVNVRGGFLALGGWHGRAG
jgi:hypothetical protein